MTTTLEEVRRMALALPGTTEGAHFRMPAFKVDGRNFIGIERGGTHVTLALPESAVNDAVSEDPTAVEPLRRNDKPIGVRVDLAEVNGEQLERLIEAAWRYRAPKALLDSYRQDHEPS